MDSNLETLYLNNIWRPSLTIIGADGIPAVKDAKNVVRKSTTFTVSLRTPPSSDPEKVKAELETTLNKDIPYDSHLTIANMEADYGWLAKPWPTGDKLKAMIDVAA